MGVRLEGSLSLDGYRRTTEGQIMDSQETVDLSKNTITLIEENV